MTVINLTRRLEKLETAKRVTSSIQNLTDEQLRDAFSRVVDQLGGKDATLSLMRYDPATSASDIKMMEGWPASWSL
jgi:hypothetical protein